LNQYLKYTQLGIQLVFYILTGYFLGGWLGPKAGFSESGGAVAGILFFLGLGLFKVIRDVLKETE
jgi:hypothetical protein